MHIGISGIYTHHFEAVQQMSTYWAILEKARGSNLRLTKFDDEIYDHFRKEFPDFDPKQTINEDEMKSKDGKEKWRQFISHYEKKVDDYNFGTMLRSNPTFKYGEKETIFGMRDPRLRFCYETDAEISCADAILCYRNFKVRSSITYNSHGIL